MAEPALCIEKKIQISGLIPKLKYPPHNIHLPVNYIPAFWMMLRMGSDPKINNIQKMMFSNRILIKLTCL